MKKKLFPEPGQPFGKQEAVEYAKIQDDFLKKLDGALGMVGVVASADGTMYLIARTRADADGTVEQAETLVAARQMLFDLLSAISAYDEDSALSRGPAAIGAPPRKGPVH